MQIFNFLLDLAEGVTNINITGTKRNTERVIDRARGVCSFLFRKKVVRVTLQLC